MVSEIKDSAFSCMVNLCSDTCNVSPEIGPQTGTVQQAYFS